MPLDYSALTARYDRDAAAALAAQLKATGPTGRRFVALGLATDVIGAVTFGILALSMVGFALGAAVQFAQHPDRVDPRMGLVYLAVALASLAAVWLLVRRYLHRTGSPETWWRLDRFAHANGMVFAPWSPQPAFPADLFSAGAGAATYNHVRREGADFVNVGNLFFLVGREHRESLERRWGFVAVLLAEPRPLMLLDAKRNNVFGSTGLRIRTAGLDTLSLPHIGDEYRLRGTERHLDQARQVFSEQLISALTAAKGVYDVQVTDRWLFLFSRGEFDMTDPELLTELFGLVDVVKAAKL